MENNELKKVPLKITRAIILMTIKIEDFDFGNILLDEKSYETIMIYDVLYKTLIGAKPLRIMFNKVDGFIRDYDGTKYLVLFGPEKYNTIYDRIRYLIGLKNRITYTFSHNYAKLKFDSDDDLPLEETFTLHNVIIIIKSVFSKNKNHYYYNMFLENVPINKLKNNCMLRFFKTKVAKKNITEQKCQQIFGMLMLIK